MADKDFFITSIPMVELQNDTHIPTVVFYGDQNKISIGYEAKAASKEVGHELLNEDFKIDIGKDDPSHGASKRRFPTASGMSDEQRRGYRWGNAGQQREAARVAGTLAG